MTDFTPNTAFTLSSLVRRIVAANAGPMTGPGTNTYLIGDDDVTVIDPGPEESAHLDAILAAAPNGIARIFLTHFHADHAPGARALAAATGAPVYACARHDDVTVDRVLADNERIEGSEYVVQALFTPGHAAQHMCFLLESERALFTGDTVLDGMTSVVTPDGGHMGAYLASLDRLAALEPQRIYPGHGGVIDDAVARVEQYAQHRRDREAEILGLLETDPTTIPAIVARVYPDLHAALVPVAEWQVYAHLVTLQEQGRVAEVGDNGWCVAG